MKLHPKPFFTKRKKAKFLKTCIKFVLFYSPFRSNDVKKNSFKITLKKLNHELIGST